MSLSAATPRAPDLSGRALGGRYELHALIGEGTFGRVYRGRDRRLARSVAVKVIKPWWAEDPNWVRSFEREAQLTASVTDPRIVQVFDVGYAEEGLYYVAELVEGESVAARLRRGPMPPWDARDLAEQLSLALASAHARRVVHGDIKPANVLISSDGRVKVADFGMARLLGGSSGQLAATVAGTPSYMAPEQARGRGSTPATDVYSIGVVLYETLSGHPPFSGGSPVEIALRQLQEPAPPLPSTIPAALAAVAARALAKDPDERYRNGGEMAEALARTRGSSRRTRAVVGAARAGANRREPPPDGLSRTLVAPWRTPRRNLNPAGRRRAVASFSVVLVVMLGMLAVPLLSDGGVRVRVPSLHGLTRAAIGAKLGRAHLRFAFRSRHSFARRGTAVGQRPARGMRVSEGSVVIATLSAGPPPVAVPRIVGFSSSDARSSLHQLGLHASSQEVPAPGVIPGTVTAQSPSPGVKLRRGSTVSLSVAESPRWRDVASFTDQDGEASAPFRIQGARWRIVYRMAYIGTCTFIFFCSGPTAHVTDVGRGTTVSTFDLGDGTDQVRTFGAGPGPYQVKVTPGDDSTRWSAEIQDYY